jgi:pyruvate,water dikinase
MVKKRVPAPQAREAKPVLWFDEVGKEDVALVGGKGANLGELVKAGIPVPPGFVVPASAYYRFLETAGLVQPLINLLQSLDHKDSYSLNTVSSRVKGLILAAAVPQDLAASIRESYRKLGGRYVAVRSSATAEDIPEASFAGQQSTFLNVLGEDNVLRAVQECWASLFEARAIFYREEQGFEHMQVGIAVVVQHMVQSEVSGVMFTVEPVSSDTGKIVVESIFGLGEAIVSGSVTPDTYILDKGSMGILEKQIARQEWKLVRNPGPTNAHPETNIRQHIFPHEQSRQKLSDERIRELADIGKRVESYYSFPQDIEWALEDGRFYLVQTRPVTTLQGPVDPGLTSKIAAQTILVGMGASPGVASGLVMVIHSADEIDKVSEGDVLVTEMTTPDFVPAMKRAAAIVTDKGGRTCHAAIVSRELGVPCVVGTDRATQVLNTSQVITVDGSRGNVYNGRVEISRPDVQEGLRDVKTRTRVYVNLADPELADRIAQRKVDGVGLLRAEFIIAHIGEHPRYMLAQGKGEEFISKLASGIEAFTKAFHPRSVVYRFTDFKTNEYRNLKGGKEYEDEEANPMIGYRGASRYITDIEVFKLEIEAIRRVRKNYDNLWLMVPFVRTPQELSGVKGILEREGIIPQPNLKLWLMVEVPSNIIILDKFIDVGIDGISIGSNDLTQLILGVDRDNSRFADLFDERNEAVMLAMERAITVAKKRGVTASICGQAPSFYPDLTAKLVEAGITSVSISPDMIDRTRQIIAEVEEKLGILPSQDQ